VPEPPPANPFEVFDQLPPRVGEPAPGFALETTAGTRATLADAVAAGPVVVYFASFTCPPSRMKLPALEALARRWAGRATVLVVYQSEAHPAARASERLNGFADQVQACDRSGDGTISVAEYGNLGARYMFDAFDLDHDGEVRSHELLAARRLEQFHEIAAPTTAAERAALAARLRAEVPGAIPFLIDGLDDATATAYGGLPNMAFVIGADGRVAAKLPWAAVPDLDRAVAATLGVAPPPAAPIPAGAFVALDAPRAAARAAKKPLLVRFTAPGCAACVELDATLAKAPVRRALARFHVVELAVDRDDAWAAFQALGLDHTPALVTFDRTGEPSRSLQGAQDVDAVATLLRR
jgi:thiol-disulfide isomerase/thioredoxin